MENHFHWLDDGYHFRNHHSLTHKERWPSKLILHFPETKAKARTLNPKLLPTLFYNQLRREKWNNPYNEHETHELYQSKKVKTKEKLSFKPSKKLQESFRSPYMFSPNDICIEIICSYPVKSQLHAEQNDFRFNSHRQEKHKHIKENPIKETYFKPTLNNDKAPQVQTATSLNDNASTQFTPKRLKLNNCKRHNADVEFVQCFYKL